MSKKLDWDSVRFRKPKLPDVSKRFIAAARKDAKAFAKRIEAGRHSTKKAGPVRIWTKEELEEINRRKS